MTLWIADTSPLLFLAKLNHLDLLRQAAEEVVIPPAVLREVEHYPDEACQRIQDACLSWLKTKPVSDLALVKVLLADLDEGEAEVLALAHEARADRVLLDDLDGRRLARRIGLVPVGTLGLLLAARLRGEIPSLREEIEKLQESGFRAHPGLVEAVLREAGEEP
jgi:predicted nucleic acid-binding protein